MENRTYHRFLIEWSKHTKYNIKDHNLVYLMSINKKIRKDTEYLFLFTKHDFLEIVSKSRVYTIGSGISIEGIVCRYLLTGKIVEPVD